MKTLCTLFLILLAGNVQANSDRLECLRDNYLSYTKKVQDYWLLKDKEFEKENADLYKEFSYLNREQMHHNRMQEITVELLVRKYPDELKLNGNIFNMVPRYKYYRQPIYRELRSISEFDKLYKEVESFKKENKMPDFERLSVAVEMLKKIDEKSNITSAMNEAQISANRSISSLGCSP